MKPHLLVITDAWHPQISGVVTTLVNTINELEAVGWKVTVISHKNFDWTTKMPGYPWIDLTVSVWNLKKLILDYNPTHVHIPVEGPLGIAAKRYLDKWGWQYTTAYHTNMDSYAKHQYGVPEFILRWFMRWFHSKSASVFVPTNTMRDKVLGFWKKSTQSPPITVWGRGVNKKTFYPNLIASNGNRKRTLLYVGRVSVEKNLGEFFKLKNDQRELVVVGDGPMKTIYESAHPDVKFVGFKEGEELAKYFREADLFVFPSKTDTYGVVLIEAISCGTPVLAYDVAGPKDALTPGINCVLVPEHLSLEIGVEEALSLDRNKVYNSSQKFTWESVTKIFMDGLKGKISGF